MIFALPASHAFGSTSGRPGTCSAFSRSAFAISALSAMTSPPRPHDRRTAAAISAVPGARSEAARSFYRLIGTLSFRTRRCLLSGPLSRLKRKPRMSCFAFPRAPRHVLSAVLAGAVALAALGAEAKKPPRAAAEPEITDFSDEALAKRFQLPLSEVGYLVVDAKTGPVLGQRQTQSAF